MLRNRRKRGGVSGRALAMAGEGFGLRALFGRLRTLAMSRNASVGHSGKQRIYPEITALTMKATLPISFVVIRFSEEYRHNFLQSKCAHDRLNEVIEVDNTSNLYFDNLSQAIIAGFKKAQNDIIAVTHEDVFLPDGWQVQFEQSLRQLEEYDPSWGMLGSVGWNASGEFIGHWSDPHQFKNTFKDSQHDFQIAEKLDEQLLIFHRQRAPHFDSNLPGIHFLGEDLKHDLARSGLRCYAINAPTIHKYADKYGEPIVSSKQSDKISDRENATYLADEACCIDYVRRKYPGLFPPKDEAAEPAALDASKKLSLQQPVIFICKGELESIVLRRVAESFGVFFGAADGEASELSELVFPLYKMVIEKFRCHAPWQKDNTAGTLQSAAAHMISDLSPGQPWGFILPESILVLPELANVFPGARYVYFQRDPLDICMGKSQRTARLDNHIGRISLPEAYRYLGIELAQILADDEIDHRVNTTIHHLELVSQHLARVSDSEPLILKVENIASDPTTSLQRLSRWLGVSYASEPILPVDIEELAKIPKEICSTMKIEGTEKRLATLRTALGYIQGNSEHCGNASGGL